MANIELKCNTKPESNTRPIGDMFCINIDNKRVVLEVEYRMRISNMVVRVVTSIKYVTQTAIYAWKP